MGLMKRFVLRVALGASVGVAAGAAVALFLYLLTTVTGYRQRTEWIVWLLPVAGLALGGAVARWADPVRAGNNLVIDSIHTDRPQIPRRVAPAVLVGAVVTHLFGGSAGREGAAVQMSATLADALSHRLRLDKRLRSELLVAGVAAGFSAAFGAPLAASVFGLEATRAGARRWRAIVPTVVASFTADAVSRTLGSHHSLYPQVNVPALDLRSVLGLAALGVAFALLAIAFIESVRFVKRTLVRFVPSSALRMALGGVAVVVLWRICGTSAYLGLGSETIAAAFSDPGLDPASFAWKGLFTAVTLGSGFLGGEVVPLFFMGSTLGNALAPSLGLPLDVAAGVGLVALFGAASNTPLALAVLAAELMGPALFVPALLTCGVAYLLTGDRSIYVAQCSLGPMRKVGYAKKRDQSA